MTVDANTCARYITFYHIITKANSKPPFVSSRLQMLSFSREFYLLHGSIQIELSPRPYTDVLHHQGSSGYTNPDT